VNAPFGFQVQLVVLADVERVVERIHVADHAIAPELGR
jgi:hypothetical protein